MKTSSRSLLCFGALSIFVAVISGCATATPERVGENGISGGPSIPQKQLERQEEISRQQRELMRF